MQERQPWNDPGILTRSEKGVILGYKNRHPIQECREDVVKYISPYGKTISCVTKSWGKYNSLITCVGSLQNISYFTKCNIRSISFFLFDHPQRGFDVKTIIRRKLPEVVASRHHLGFPKLYKRNIKTGKPTHDIVKQEEFVKFISESGHDKWLSVEMAQIIIECFDIPCILWQYECDGRYPLSFKWYYCPKTRPQQKTMEMIYYPDLGHFDLIRRKNQEHFAWWKWCYQLQTLLHQQCDPDKRAEYLLTDEIHWCLKGLRKIKDQLPPKWKMILVNVLSQFRTRKYIRQIIDRSFEMTKLIPNIDDVDKDDPYLGWTCRIPISIFGNNFSQLEDEIYCVPPPIFAGDGVINRMLVNPSQVVTSDLSKVC